MKPLQNPTTKAAKAHSALVAVLTLGLVACTSVLPNSQTSSKSPWNTYTEAKSAFDEVTPGKTSKSELRGLGFSPELVPNTRVLNYVDVVNLFGASFRIEDLPEGVRLCVKAREDCQAYVVRGQNTKNNRNGNVPMDLLGFRKRTHTTGWEFSATLVMVKNTVTYKLWNGTPSVETTTSESNPLGPMQSLGGIIPKPF